jgi:hypothetical protein
MQTMTLTSQKVARSSTTRSPNEDPDPLSFGTTLADIIAELKDAKAILTAIVKIQLRLAQRAAGAVEAGWEDPPEEPNEGESDDKEGESDD